MRMTKMKTKKATEMLHNGERVDIRIPATVKTRLKRVASLSGRSMSDFIVAAAIEKAEEVASSIERWELDATDSRIVLEALSDTRDLPGLRALLAETQPAADSEPIANRKAVC